MKNIIYTIYVDINSEKNKIYNFYYDEIVNLHEQYAESLDCDYVVYNNFKSFKNLSDYDSINFNKYYIAEQLLNKYDQVVFLDFDIIPNTTDNIFTTFCFDDGVVVRKIVDYSFDNIKKYIDTFDEYYAFKANSDFVKLVGANILRENSSLFNTGILGFNKKTYADLNIFSNFYPEFRNVNAWPNYITQHLTKNNEILFSSKINKYVDLTDHWHHLVDWKTSLSYFWDIESSDFKTCKFRHFIQKNFERQWIE